ncbi:hypothetical protein CIT32_11275 [Micrococcus luteus]|uniref:helix-turn-helix domain-containing protein n=1 Tax=Micrococcus luteus TaxID=1270 RepID=UPI000BACC910|nr:helix-turn-helix domain-containing protein [Micrococcus luteus]PAW31197.1 hypothetical protein CIT32_11275 [Micrococcus luteus]
MAHLSDRQKAELVRQHQDGVPWTRIAEHSGVAVRTLQRWAARMEMGQLSRAPRSDKGSTRVNAELVKAIEALAVRRPGACQMVCVSRTERNGKNHDHDRREEPRRALGPGPGRAAESLRAA